MNVRLIREVTETGPSGPAAGMHALQAALRAQAPDWLCFGGEPQAGELPWFWSWQDAETACCWAAAGLPFVMGPNIFFHRADAPGSELRERILLSAASCRMIFTESTWYRDLIAAQPRLHCDARIEIWPYPLPPSPSSQIPDPEAQPPEGVLVVAKSGLAVRDLAGLRGVLAMLGGAPPELLVYGYYRREELLAAARRRRVCLYLSESDRGPIALAEILGEGCPAVGTARGAPWVIDGETGYQVPGFGDPQQLLAALLGCLTLDRRKVAQWAARTFDATAIAERVIGHLKNVRAALQVAGK